MKRFIVVFVALGLLAGLVGCGGGGINAEGNNAPVEGRATDSSNEQTIFNGPYGVTADLNKPDELVPLYDCIEDHKYFNQEILGLVIDQAINAYSDNEFGWVWDDFGVLLVEDYTVITGLIGCEEAFPRIFDEVYTVGLANTIDSCSLVSNFSSESTDRLCNNSLDVLSRKLSAIVDRVNALDEFFGEINQQLNS